MLASSVTNLVEIKREIKNILDRWEDNDYDVVAIYLGVYETSLVKNSPVYGHAEDIYTTDGGQIYIFDIPVFECETQYGIDAQVQQRTETIPDYIYPQNYSGDCYGQFSEQLQTIEKMKDSLYKSISEKEIYCTCGTKLEVEFESDYVQVKPCPKCLEEKSKICPFWQLKE